MILYICHIMLYSIIVYCFLDLLLCFFKHCIGLFRIVLHCIFYLLSFHIVYSVILYYIAFYIHKVILFTYQVILCVYI